MSTNITDPVRGGDILQWAQGVTETCRRFGGVGSANLLTRDGVGGVGFEPLPANRRERRAANAVPWTFSCTEDPQTHERTGGWSNCRMQVGFDTRWHSPDLGDPDESSDQVIAGCTETADGTYYVVVDFRAGTCTITTSYRHEPHNDVVSIYIGRVQDGRLRDAPHLNPVAYAYL